MKTPTAPKPPTAPSHWRRAGLRQTLAATARLAALLAMVGCSHVSDRVVLLPQADGSASGLLVRKGQQELLLDKPYAALEVNADGLQPLASDAAQVKQRYGALLGLQPPRPQRFVVRFEQNGNRLTADATPELARMRQALALLKAPEVIVTGHTDSVGATEMNDKLSLQRAEAVRELLVAAGVPREAVLVVGRGEREPEVPTADEVAEPRNRRVEIKIR